MKEEFFYLGIENPDTVRRSLLEASKELVIILQKYEVLKGVRAEKYAQAAKLKIIYDDILSMLSSIKAEFPEVDIKELPKYEELRKREKEQQPNKADSAKSDHGLNRLEVELSDIEEKLKMLK